MQQSGCKYQYYEERMQIIKSDSRKENTATPTHTLTHTFINLIRKSTLSDLSIILKLYLNTNILSYLYFSFFQVCNNKDNCHCKPRYLPPNCNTEDDSFPGGSIDSGNFPPTGARNPGKY